MKAILGILVALTATTATADTLGDLRSAVGKLNARQPIRAVYASDVNVKASGKYANENQKRTVTATVAHDLTTGLTITIPQALVEKAARAATTREISVNDGIGTIRPEDVIEALDFRDSFLDMLKGATVTEEKKVLFRGKQARLLVLKVNQPVRRRNSIVIGSVKVAEDRLSVWLDDGDLPLAAERFRKTRAGFLIFNADSSNRTHYTFAHSGDRLVLARLETSSNGAALGQKMEEASVHTLTVQ